MCATRFPPRSQVENCRRVATTFRSRGYSAAPRQGPAPKRRKRSRPRRTRMPTWLAGKSGRQHRRTARRSRHCENPSAPPQKPNKSRSNAANARQRGDGASNTQYSAHSSATPNIMAAHTWHSSWPRPLSRPSSGGKAKKRTSAIAAAAPANTPMVRINLRKNQSVHSPSAAATTKHTTSSARPHWLNASRVSNGSDQRLEAAR